MVAEGVVSCWRCLKPIRPGGDFHLGHDDNDRSAGQKKTRALVDGGLDLLVQGFSMSSNPVLQPVVKPIRTKVIHLLEDAELVPTEKR